MPLTTAVDRWSGGGSGDGAGTVITIRGTTQVLTSAIIMIGVRGTVQVYEVVSTRNDPEAHVAASHWWIQLAVTRSILEDSHLLCFTTFSNPLFDSNDDFISSDDESLSDEDVLMENFKIYSNPLFDDEEIISPKIDPHYFNAESNLIESLLNHDILIDSSPKFDNFLKEFSGKLAHIDPILPGIEKADFDLEEEIRLVENLLYDNSSPRPPKELNLEIVDTILESLSPSPILIEDSDSHMEEIDLFLVTNDSMPPGIEDDDYDSEGDIYFLEELLNNDSLPLLENESSNLDHFNDPSPSRPPLEPPDVEICFDFKPDTGVVTNKVVGDISEHDVLMTNLLPTQPTLCPVFDPLLPFLSEKRIKCSTLDSLRS
ncbi:hypothetical protein Tco_0556424 [Tanacetum coccineum]